MISLLIALVVLVIIVTLIARPVLAGIGAPGWLYQVVVGIAIIIAIYLIAGALGFSTPNLK